MTEMARYLKCTAVIDCDAQSVREKAEALTRCLVTDGEKAVTLYYFVRDDIKHDAYAPTYEMEKYKASATLQRGGGHCEHKAVLLAALCRAVGIPARLGFVDMRDHRLSEKFRRMLGGDNLVIQHGYVEVYINGKWIHACPAYDLETCQKHKFVPVDFDGISDAKDSPYDQEGRPHIEHVKDHGHYEDFPWDWIVRYRKEWVERIGMEWKEFAQTWNPESSIQD